MQHRKLSCLLAFTLTSLIIYPQQIEAQSINRKQLPPTTDAPKGRARGTGDRGECAGVEFTLIPLIPSNTWGLTIDQNPSVWVYVDYKSARNESQIYGTFTLEKRPFSPESSPVQRSIPLPKTSGVFSIPFPDSLQKDQWYNWYFKIDCQEQEFSGYGVPLFIQGSIKRIVSPDLESQVRNASPDELLRLYKEEYLWYDSLSAAARLRCQPSQNFVASDPWIDLLEAVELGELYQAQLICTP